MNFYYYLNNFISQLYTKPDERLALLRKACIVPVFFFSSPESPPRVILTFIPNFISDTHRLIIDPLRAHAKYGSRGIFKIRGRFEENNFHSEREHTFFLTSNPPVWDSKVQSRYHFIERHAGSVSLELLTPVL
jgi:hypothetical protein